ncbi:MAG: serine/threonine protein kinase [Telmatospirillum sp.]|nr:serine/threonine protein kinase [Telmatospirillum sp.]
MTRLHGTCVLIGDIGVLLRGPSGAGKSDLALRLIEGGARLVSDDQVEVRRDGARLMAQAPATIAGMIEVRGLGLVRMPPVGPVPLGLVIDLVPREAVDRLPDEQTEEIAGVALPRLAFHPWEASAATKVRLAVQVATGTIMLVP